MCNCGCPQCPHCACHVKPAAPDPVSEALYSECIEKYQNTADYMKYSEKALRAAISLAFRAGMERVGRATAEELRAARERGYQEAIVEARYAIASLRFSEIPRTQAHIKLLEGKAP